MKKLIFLFLFSLIDTIYFHSNEEIESLIKLALKNNPDLKSMIFDVRSKKSDIVVNFAIPSPMLSFEMMNIPVTESHNNPMQEKKITFTQEIPFPVKMILNSLVKKEEFEISKLKYEKMCSMLRKEITTMYYMIALMNRKIEIMNDEKNKIEIMFNLSKSKYETGATLRDEFLKVALMKSMIEKDILMMEMERNVVINKLLKMMSIKELPQNINFVLDEVKEESFFDKEKIYQTVKKENYDLNIKELNIKKYARASQAMLAHLIPDFNFSFSIDIPDNGGTYFSFMIGAMVPLYFLVGELPKSRVDFEMKKMAEYELISEKNSLIEMIDNNIEIINKNIEILNLIKKSSLKPTKANIEILLKEYIANKINYEMFLNEIISLYKLNIEIEDIKFQILNSIENIKFLTGYKIEIFN